MAILTKTSTKDIRRREMFQPNSSRKLSLAATPRASPRRPPQYTVYCLCLCSAAPIDLRDARLDYPHVLEDTDPAALSRYTELLQAMTPEQRARATLGMCRGVRRAVILCLRAQHPGITEDELRVRLMARVYGRKEAVRVFGHVPDDAY